MAISSRLVTRYSLKLSRRRSRHCHNKDCLPSMSFSESVGSSSASNRYLCNRLFHTFDCCGRRHLCRRNPGMDDVYKINVAKTKFREAYETGNVGRLVSVFSPNGFTDMSEDGPSKYGPEAIATLR